jgi:hypothetical protein
MSRQIELDDDDSVIILSSNGELKMIIPTPEDPKALIPPSVLFMTGLGVLIAKDVDIYNYVMKRIDELLEEHVMKLQNTDDVRGFLDFFSTNLTRF